MEKLWTPDSAKPIEPGWHPTPDARKPVQKWCPINDGIPGEKVIRVFDVIDYPSDSDDEEE
jgi:hypothetical protein